MPESRITEQPEEGASLARLRYEDSGATGLDTNKFRCKSGLDK